MRCSSSSTSNVRRWVSSNDATACPSDGVIIPEPTASSTLPIAPRAPWEPSRAGRSSEMVPVSRLNRQYAAQTEPEGRWIALHGQIDTPPCEGFGFAIEQCLGSNRGFVTSAFRAPTRIAALARLELTILA